jgi:hypothetical protein
MFNAKTQSFIENQVPELYVVIYFNPFIHKKRFLTKLNLQ